MGWVLKNNWQRVGLEGGKATSFPRLGAHLRKMFLPHSRVKTRRILICLKMAASLYLEWNCVVNTFVMISSCLEFVSSCSSHSQNCRDEVYLKGLYGFETMSQMCKYRSLFDWDIIAYHKIYPFKVYSLVVFSVFDKLFDQHCYLIPENFCNPNKRFHAHSDFPYLPSPQTLASTSLLPFLWIYLF